MFLACQALSQMSLSRLMMNLWKRLKTMIWTRCAAFLGAENRTVEKVMLLTEHGAKVDAPSVNGYSALHAIADYMWRHDYDATTDDALAKLLVSHGADLEKRDEYRLTPLLRAVICGNASELAALLASGADPNV